ncbi:antibiotic biosynthesis monooxygenase family protein [Psychrobacillus sp. NPDC096426]|uniref:antibiotic biosynthesis monooxygenase family protein n=1 Tax=Psychrobacillus sp. NPDC096426 TaxID=3364491 RepID=UPI00381D2137
MVQETMLLEVNPGTQKDFEFAFKKAAVFISQAKGCLGYEMQRCVENENKYLVMIKWETIEDHIIHFKNSEAFSEMKELIGPYYLNRPLVEHYEIVNLL